MYNARKDSKKYRQYFEHSENPTYSITRYTRNKVIDSLNIVQAKRFFLSGGKRSVPK